MSVEERLMTPGRFEVKFIEDTPYWVRSIFSEGADLTDSACQMLGHLFITPARLPAAMQDLTTLLAASQYTGIVRRRLRRGISGSNLLWYFGNEDGIGAAFQAKLPLTQGFSAWVHDIVNDEPAGYASPYDVGTITNIGSATLELDPYLMTRRAALDYVCDFFDGEYRVNPDNTFDAGTAADLFVTTPTQVIMPKGGVSDLSLQALQALTLDQEVDFDWIATDMQQALSGGLFEGVNVGLGATVPKDLNGNSLQMVKFVESPARRIADALTAIAGQGHSGARKTVKMSAAGYDLPTRVAAGDTLYVYDPDNQLFDLTNQVQFAGRTVFPVKLRAHAVTWPIQDGMGVYYRVSSTGAVTDLSDWVEWEDSGTDFEVGAPKREMVPSTVTSLAAKSGFDARARVYRSTTQLIPNTTDTPLEFTDTRYDPDTLHDPSTATSQRRFTIGVAGKYSVGACVSFDGASSTGFRLLQLRVNGSVVIESITKAAVVGAATRLGVSTDWDFAADDYVEALVYQSSGGVLSVEASTGWQSEFWIHRFAA